MSISVRHNSIVTSFPNNEKYAYSGSSSLKIDIEGNIISTPKRIDKPRFKEPSEHEPIYKLNKGKVRAKISAFSKMYDSNSKMKMITISFPRYFDDEYCRKALNTWLTRCRKLNEKFEYIWIAERQKNDTLHFHILTYTYFNVRIINHFMAKTIQNIIKNDDCFWLNFDHSKYNGVDVTVIYNTRDISKYVTKYVSKNNNTEKFLLWNCSAKISRLFTSAILTESEFKYALEFMQKLEKLSQKIKTSSYDIEIDVYINKKGKEPPFYKKIAEINKIFW